MSNRRYAERPWRQMAICVAQIGTKIDQKRIAIIVPVPILFCDRLKKWTQSNLNLIFLLTLAYRMVHRSSSHIHYTISRQKFILVSVEKGNLLKVRPMNAKSRRLTDISVGIPCTIICWLWRSSKRKLCTVQSEMHFAQSSAWNLLVLIGACIAPETSSI